MTQSELREELARLIASPLNNLDNKHGADLSLARASEIANAIISRFDLVPKGSVVVPADGTLLAAERDLDGWLCQFCNEVGDPADDVESWRDGIISALRGLSNAYNEWYKLRPHLDSDLLAARPGASHE